MVVETVDALPENNILDSAFINNINNMGTFTYSPLAEGLTTIGGYYDSPSSHVVGYYCQQNFVIVVSPGISSMDRHGASQSTKPYLWCFLDLMTACCMRCWIPLLVSVGSTLPVAGSESIEAD